MHVVTLSTQISQHSIKQWFPLSVNPHHTYVSNGSRVCISQYSPSISGSHDIFNLRQKSQRSSTSKCFHQSVAFVNQWPSSVNDLHQLIDFITQWSSSIIVYLQSVAFVSQWPSSINGFHHSVVFIYQQPLLVTGLHRSVDFISQWCSSITNFHYLVPFVSQWISLASRSHQPMFFNHSMVFFISQWSSWNIYEPYNTNIIPFLQVVLLNFPFQVL